MASSRCWRPKGIGLSSAELRGVSVLVAGAGLAGLSAARDLVDQGAAVIVMEARDRVGGRVQTIRDGFASGQHGEAGGDLIDDGQSAIKALAEDLGLKLRRILRRGWGYARADRAGRLRIRARSLASAWAHVAREIDPLVARYRLAERRWDSAVAADLGRRSVADWLAAQRADRELRDTARGLRGFFLADPEDLSLLALVDQFAENDGATPGHMYRVDGGNDRLAGALAARLGERIQLSSELIAVRQTRRGIDARVRHLGRTATLSCDYLVTTLPATLLRRVAFTPPLPDPQRRAVVGLAYGRATKTLLQFSRPFWRAPWRPAAFGSPTAIGAAWDGSDEQRGRAGILTLLAGGGASADTQAILARHGPAGLAEALAFLGARRATLLHAHATVWERDPWARGGYALFDTRFDPALRDWLARPFGRVLFAGEHTSIRWQGYMNGAVESGRRSAAEVLALTRLGRQNVAH